MLNIKKHQFDWRLLFWILLLISIFGSWFFESVYKPPDAPCSIRLRDNSCGEPLPGIWVLRTLFLILGGSIVNLVRETAVNYDAGHAFLISLFLLSFVFPFFSTLLIVIRGDHRPQLAFHLIACSVVFSVGLIVILIQHFKQFWLLWGVWLYVVSLASMLILEVVVLAAKRRHNQ